MQPGWCCVTHRQLRWRQVTPARARHWGHCNKVDQKMVETSFHEVLAEHSSLMSILLMETAENQETAHTFAEVCAESWCLALIAQWDSLPSVASNHNVFVPPSPLPSFPQVCCFVFSKGRCGSPLCFDVLSANLESPPFLLLQKTSVGPPNTPKSEVLPAEQRTFSN